MDGASFEMTGNNAYSPLDCIHSNFNDDPSISFPDEAPETMKCNYVSSFSCSSTSSSSTPFSCSSSSVTDTTKISPHCVSLKKASLSRRGYKSFEDWNSNPNHVYIGRNMSHHVPGALGSKWGNPFKPKKSNKYSLKNVWRDMRII